MNETKARVEILYFYDALCGWCYGFSPVIRQLYDKYKDQWHFHVFSGGMMMGERMGSINQVAPYIKTAYKDVENRSGVKFGETFLKEVLEPGTAILSSLEPAIIMNVFKSFRTGREIELAAALQKAIYYDGVLPQDLERFVPYAVALGVDEAEFLYRLGRPEYHDGAFDDFKMAQQFGIQGFPTTVMVLENDYYLLSHGYTDFESLEKRVGLIMEKAEQERKVASDNS